jgi:hypothetical protein
MLAVAGAARFALALPPIMLAVARAAVLALGLVAPVLALRPCSHFGWRPCSTCSYCKTRSSYTRPVLGGRSSLGRAAALLAGFPPSTTLGLLGPACGACRHPGSPVLLSGSSVGQRGISAQTIQLLVPVTLNYIGALQHISPLPPVHCQLHLQLSSLNSGRLTRRTSLRSTAASAITEAVPSLNSPSSHCPSSSTPLQQLLLVVYCVEAGVVRCSLTHAAASPERLRVLLSVGVGVVAAWVAVLPVAADVAVVVAVVLAAALAAVVPG